MQSVDLVGGEQCSDESPTQEQINQDTQQPSTPPLTPHQDTDFFSPSPLRIRNDGGETGSNAQPSVQDKQRKKYLAHYRRATGNSSSDDEREKVIKEKLPFHEALQEFPRIDAVIAAANARKSVSQNKSGDGHREEKSQDMPKDVEEDMTASILGTRSGSTDIANLDKHDKSLPPGWMSMSDLDSFENKDEWETEGESEDDEKDKGKDKVMDFKKMKRPAFPPRNSSLQAKSVHASNTTAFLAGASTKSTPKADNVLDSTAGNINAQSCILGPNASINKYKPKNSDKDKYTGLDEHHKYISPSDALVSPCTQKLTALKMKKTERIQRDLESARRLMRMSSHSNDSGIGNASSGSKSVSGSDSPGLAQRLLKGRFSLFSKKTTAGGGNDEENFKTEKGEKEKED